MSISASINIKLVRKVGLEASFRTIIETLNDHGWSLINRNRALYLPSGDDGDYNWKLEELKLDDLMCIIDSKEKNKEVAGVQLLWQETEIGGHLLIFNSSELSFNITVNKKYIKIDNGMRLIDTNWYVEKLIPCLSKQFTVERFTFEQFG